MFNDTKHRAVCMRQLSFLLVSIVTGSMYPNVKATGSRMEMFRKIVRIG